MGNAACGKSALISQISGNIDFPKEYQMTLHCEMALKTVAMENQSEVDLYIKDMGGHEAFQEFAHRYYRTTQVFVIVFDANNLFSFKSVKDYCARYRAAKGLDSRGVLIGTKIDLQRQVTYSQGLELAKELSLEYFECSAVRMK